MKDFILQQKEGERMAIRVDEKLPKQGVLILLDREEENGPFIVTSEKRYPIVSLRQPPELCGINESELNPEKRDIWIKQFREKFCNSLTQAVLESCINTLLIAAGGTPWRRSSYATCLPGVTVSEVASNL